MKELASLGNYWMKAKLPASQHMSHRSSANGFERINWLRIAQNFCGLIKQ
jgi:hypothetical protein